MACQARVWLPMRLSKESAVVPNILWPLCALVAWFYIRSLQKLQHLSSKSALSPGVIIAACTLTCILTGGVVPELLGHGRQTMQDMLSGAFDLNLLIVLLVDPGIFAFPLLNVRFYLRVLRVILCWWL